MGIKALKALKQLDYCIKQTKGWVNANVSSFISAMFLYV